VVGEKTIVPADPDLFGRAPAPGHDSWCEVESGAPIGGETYTFGLAAYPLRGTQTRNFPRDRRRPSIGERGEEEGDPRRSHCRPIPLLMRRTSSTAGRNQPCDKSATEKADTANKNRSWARGKRNKSTTTKKKRIF